MLNRHVCILFLKSSFLNRSYICLLHNHCWDMGVSSVLMSVLSVLTSRVVGRPACAEPTVGGPPPSDGAARSVTVRFVTGHAIGGLGHAAETAPTHPTAVLCAGATNSPWECGAAPSLPPTHRSRNGGYRGRCPPFSIKIVAKIFLYFFVYILVMSFSQNLLTDTDGYQRQEIFVDRFLTETYRLPKISRFFAFDL